MDRMAQLAMAATQEALADAGLPITEGNRTRIGVVLGSGIGGIGSLVEGVQTLQEKGPSRVSPFVIPMMLPDTAPGMISINYGLRGPNMAIATACASGNNAVGEAARMIRAGVVDAMITGGCGSGHPADLHCRVRRHGGALDAQ